MKKSFLIAAAAALTLALSGCGSDTGKYVAYLDTDEYVVLCEYDEIPISLSEPEVTDEDVCEYIEEILESAAGFEDVEKDALEEGDWANITYTGYVDGEAFEGGSNTNFALEIGSGTFMDGFEEGLIGASAGDTVTVYVTFPDDYSIEEAAGKEGYFEVKINSIQEYKTYEYTDEDVAALGIEGVSDCDDLYGLAEDDLWEALWDEWYAEAEELAADYVIENSELILIPQDYYDYIYDDMYSYYEEFAEYYGITLDELMTEYVGEEEGAAAIESLALDYVKQAVVFQAIANAEDLNPTDDEVMELAGYYAEYYGYETAEEFLEEADVEIVRESLMQENVYAFLGEHAVSW